MSETNEVKMGPVERLLRDALATYKKRGGAVGKELVGGRCCAVGATLLVRESASNADYWAANDVLDEVVPLLDPTLPVPYDEASPFSNMVAAAQFNDRYVPKHGPLPVRNLFRRAIRLAQERGL